VRVIPVRILVFTTLFSTIIAGCSGSGESESPARQTATTRPESASTRTASAQTPLTVERIPNGPWTDLARRLVESKNIETAVNVTREVLARGGVATFDGDRVLVNVTMPAAAFQVSPLETVHMAMEARRRHTASRLTAAELAQMLEGFGFPFPGARADGGNASHEPRGKVAPADEEKMRQAELAERKSAREAGGSADAAMEQAIEQERQASPERVDAAQRRITELTDAWQKARQAVRKAPAGERSAAEARVKEAWDARTAAIQELGRVRKADSEAEDDRRTRVSRARDEAYRLERIQSHIGSDFANGERLMEMLAAWVRNAAANPNDPRNFTPLFLAEMARLQDPPVDLLGSRFTRTGRGDGAPVDLRGGPRSGQLRLTLLEIQLMAAVFLRVPSASASLAHNPWMGRPDVLRASYIPAVQDGPCSDFMKSVEELGKKIAGDLGGAGASGVVGDAAGDALDKTIESGIGEAAAEALGKVMDAFGLVAKIAKLVSFYGDTQVSVVPEPRSIHKPLGNNEYVAFTATAGVSDEDLAEYERAVKTLSEADRATRDCLEVAGMPRLSNLSDLAKEAEEWLVDWKLVEGSPPHAYFSRRTNESEFYVKGTRQAMKLKRTGAGSASAMLVVDILPEEKHTGTVVRAHVTARASVDAAGMPSIGTILNPLTGVLGLVESLVELGAGWFQYMNQPKAYGTIEVEYHCPKPTIFYETGKPVADGGGGDGPNDCVIAGDRRK
jgi:hypothetical protein